MPPPRRAAWKGLLGEKLSELSSGQKQRVALAAAIACGPAVLVLDEPTSNLDAQGSEALVRILADNALDAVHWMEDHGLVYEKEPFTAIGGLWQRGHAVEVEKKGEQGGSYYVSCLKDSADKTGKVTLYTDAKVEQLVEEGGKVTGVAGTRPRAALPLPCARSPWCWPRAATPATPSWPWSTTSA